jgi:SOS-response transcriptional repressor LexA
MQALEHNPSAPDRLHQSEYCPAADPDSSPTTPAGYWLYFLLRGIPIYGSISAGFANQQEQGVDGTVPVDLTQFRIQPSLRTFALQVPDDSLISRHILPGDIVVLEHALQPRCGDLVAAYVRGVLILRYFLLENGESYLCAANPKYSNRISTRQLVIPGVAVILIRKVN